MGWDPGLRGAFRFPAGPVRTGLKPLLLAPLAHSPGVTSWMAPARVTWAETCVSSCPGEQPLLDEHLAPESCRVQSLLSHQDFHDGGGVPLSPVTPLAKWEIILDPVPPHTPIFSHPPSLVHRFCFLRALQWVCVFASSLLPYLMLFFLRDLLGALLVGPAPPLCCPDCGQAGLSQMGS